MAEHTPRRWEVYADIGTLDGTLKVAPEGWSGSRGSMPPVAAVYGSAKTQVANAYLIAAAPELLEALRELLAIRESEGGEWYGSGRLYDALDDARLAIAKVEGVPV